MGVGTPIKYRQIHCLKVTLIYVMYFSWECGHPQVLCINVVSACYNIDWIVASGSIRSYKVLKIKINVFIGAGQNGGHF